MILIERISCSSQKVNFTRKNLDYLRKERYDPMMEETLNKVLVWPRSIFDQL